MNGAKKTGGAFSWMSNDQYAAQVGHFFGAVSVILVASMFAIVLRAGWEPIWWTYGAGVLAASVKEFIFDVAPWGEGDSWGDSLMDWSFYMLGGFVSLGLSAWAHALQ